MPSFMSAAPCPDKATNLIDPTYGFDHFMPLLVESPVLRKYDIQKFSYRDLIQS